MIEFIFIAIAVAVAVWFGYIGATDDFLFDSIPGRIFGAIGGFVLGGMLAGFFGLLIMLGIGQALGLDDKGHETGSETSQLVAINMQSSVKGQFFLGSGVIGGENRYVYYYKTDVGYASDSVPAGSVDIIETDAQPKIVKHTWEYPEWFAHHVTIGYTWTIYVPKGSIKPLVDMNLPE